MSGNKVLVHQTDALQGGSTTFHFYKYQQVMLEASNVEVNSLFLQKPPITPEKKKPTIFPPKIKPVLPYPVPPY